MNIRGHFACSTQRFAAPARAAASFFSTDYNWNHEADGKLNYNAKDLLDAFNNQMIPGGSMDWGLAYHPYSIPLTEPEFWNDPGDRTDQG